MAMVCEKRLQSLYVLNWCRHSLGHIGNNADGSTWPEISKMSFRMIFVRATSHTILRIFEPHGRRPCGRLSENMKEAVGLPALRDGLLSKLNSGEIRVREAENLVEAVV